MSLLFNFKVFVTFKFVTVMDETAALEIDRFVKFRSVVVNVLKVPADALNVVKFAFAFEIEVWVIPVNSPCVCPLDANPPNAVESPSMSATLWVCPDNATSVPFTVTAFADTVFTAKFAEPLTERSLKYPMSAVTVSFSMSLSVIPVRTVERLVMSEIACP
jgi:hypothetical protein